ncbi:MAG: hypothetical protein GY769_18955 [bacterium]|nr:hypothetical protein [bacterium]
MNEPATPMAQQAQPAFSETPPPAAPVESRSTSYVDSRRKSPSRATWLSLMPGLGQVYLGYYQRGFLNAIVAAIVISLLASESLGPLTPLAGIFLAFFWLYNMIDAGRRATLYNHALAGGTEIELPDDFQVPGFRGTIAGGATLVVLGLVLLGHTRFGLSLDWIEQWWPLAVVAFGAFLAYRGIQEKAESD